MSRVGIVVVSHSSKIAEGLVELAGQMASDVRIVAAGGTDEGEIGTSFEKVSAAIADADDGAGVAVLCDLGSAYLTAETALDFLDDEVRERVRIVDAPLVEGAVAAAVAAQGEGDLAGVVAAARTAVEVSAISAESSDTGAEPQMGQQSTQSDRSGQNEQGGQNAQNEQSGRTEREEQGVPSGQTAQSASDTVTLVNRQGLHARPAAEFVKLAGSFDAAITVNDVDAKSLLRIMALGLVAGDQVRLTATGPAAPDAVKALGDLVRSGFGED